MSILRTPRSTGHTAWRANEVDMLLTWIENNLHLTQNGKQTDWHRMVKNNVFSAPEYDHITVKRITEKVNNLKKAFRKAKRLQGEMGMADREADCAVGDNALLESCCKNFWRVDAFWGDTPASPTALRPRPARPRPLDDPPAFSHSPLNTDLLDNADYNPTQPALDALHDSAAEELARALGHSPPSSAPNPTQNPTPPTSSTSSSTAPLQRPKRPAPVYDDPRERWERRRVELEREWARERLKMERELARERMQMEGRVAERVAEIQAQGMERCARVVGEGMERCLRLVGEILRGVQPMRQGQGGGGMHMGGMQGS